MTKDTRSLKSKLYEIIFEANTPKGKAFDVVLIFYIICSSIVVLLDSIDDIHQTYGSFFTVLEWFFVISFSVEYILRLYCVEDKKRYARSFFGVIDLMSILPGLISLILPSAQFLIVIRILRLLRLFRIFKMVRYVKESSILLKALGASRPKITVFIFTMLFVVTIVGAIMYIVEGPENGYSSIPTSMYWAIITVTTVGYGDISPHTPLGQFIASMLMVLAYGVLAVPTGIITYEIAQVSKKTAGVKVCPVCHFEENPAAAVFCSNCGERFPQ